MRGNQKCDAVAIFEHLSERTSHVSLELWEIRPLAVVVARRKVALREETYAWASDLRSFDKLHEVGVSPYLGFTLYLSVLQCFGWFEALNGRLIGSKSWNRSVGILRPTDSPYQF